MALGSGGIAQFSAGAGRTAMVFWPGWNDTLTSGVGPNSGLITGRGGAASVSAGVGSSVGGTGVIQHIAYQVGNPGVYAQDQQLGQNVVMLKCAAATDTARVQWNQGFPYFEQAQLAAGILPDRFARVWRFIARVNFPKLAAAIAQTAADIGMCIVPGNVASMNGGANRPGIQFGPTDVDVWTLRGRTTFKAGYDIQQNFTPAQLGLRAAANGDTGFFNLEMRIVSADNNGPATFKLFVNEVQQGPTISFTTLDNRVPGPGAGGGGFNGFVPQLINSAPGAGNPTYIWHFKYMAMILSPDEQGNL